MKKPSLLNILYKTARLIANVLVLLQSSILGSLHPHSTIIHPHALPSLRRSLAKKRKLFLPPIERRKSTLCSKGRIVQSLAERWSPGCVNAADKARKK